MRYPRASLCPRCRRPLSPTDWNVCHWCGHDLDPHLTHATLDLDQDDDDPGPELANLTGFPMDLSNMEVLSHD